MPSKSKPKSSASKNATNPTNPAPSHGAIKAADNDVKASSALQNGPTSSSPTQPYKQIQPPKPQQILEQEETVQEDESSAGPAVNRKKQKRRMKEAAKRAATQTLTDDGSHAGRRGSSNMNGDGYDTAAYEGPEDGDDVYYTDEGNRNYATNTGRTSLLPNGYANHNYIAEDPLGVGKKKKKRTAFGQDTPGSYMSPPPHGHLQRPPPPPPPPLTQSHSTSLMRSGSNEKKDRIWNTSTQEERERIKEFWLSLGEADRRSLVRIEKEAVLKKMKEQQKHSCSCTVCGRKRTAIEEELEVLYDAYYEELETYANHQQFGLDGPTIPPPRSYARPRPPLPPSQHPGTRGGGHIVSGRIEELDDDDVGDEEDYSDEDEEDDISDSEIEPPLPPQGGIFNFGNSLTAQGGILTVADDLLKNDGKKFIEMMEQLAERRMQREEEARMVASGMGHPSMRHGPPEEEDDDYDEEGDEEDFNSEEDDEFEDDEMAMTEEQRMEEGRRMFQIFAARMFEQRVLNAYRQKVAEERQQKLIEELAEDEQLDAQREAKKAKEAQKKKDKRQKQKQAKDEEKAKREQEKAAEEAAARAVEEKKAEEQRQRKEEQRRKKEAEKKAAEEERKRKEDEKQRQLRERKEQQAEQERKQREAKEREKKKRDEIKKKGLEEREVKEREAAERKEREAKVKAENDAKSRLRHQEILAAQAAPITKRPSPANITVPTPSTLQPQQRSHTPSSHASPRLPIATPAIPKPPTPGRPKQKSFQGSRAASPKPSQPASSSTASPATSSEQQAAAHSRRVSQPSTLQTPSQVSRFSPVDPPPSAVSHPPGFSNVLPTTSPGFSSPFGAPMSPGRQQAPSHPPGFPTQQSFGTNYFQNPNMTFPPGINTMRQVPPSQTGGNVGHQMPKGSEPPKSSATLNNQGRFGPQDPISIQTHSRNQSASSTISPRDPSQRPAPIQRPPSTTPHQQGENARPRSRDVDDLSNHLGSSALLDDAPEEAPVPFGSLRQGGIAVGGPRGQRQGAFGSAPGFASIGSNTRADNSQQMSNSLWGSSPAPFGASNRTTQSFSSAPGFARPNNGGAFMNSASRPVPRPLMIRLLICNVCDRLNHFQPANQGWHLADHVLQEVQASMPRNEPGVAIMEMLQMCDTEGNAQNGGGSFEYRTVDKVFLIKHQPDGSSNGRNGVPPGKIGSPIGSGPGGNSLGPIGGQSAFQQSGGFPPSSGF